MRKFLVVGGSGQVGTQLVRALRCDGGRCEVTPTSRTPQRGFLSFDPAALGRASGTIEALDALAPDCIIFVGAMAHVDGCESAPELAFRANANGPSAVASYARARGARFVFFSTDYVFDGSGSHPGPYSETAIPRPLSVYGRSKLQGERAVLRVHPDALVIRTSWVYGPDTAGKNFVHALLRHLHAGERIRVPSDQVSTPTYNRDLAQTTLKLIELGASGIVHVTGPELMSRVELAGRVATFFELDGNLIDAVPTSALGQVAPRPLESGLVSERFGRDLPAMPLQTLTEALFEAQHELQSS